MFVMWWIERRDRISEEERNKEFTKLIADSSRREDKLADLIQSNTQASTAMTHALERVVNILDRGVKS